MKSTSGAPGRPVLQHLRGSVATEPISAELIERLPASREPGLQLADTLVSSFFQSLERTSPHYDQKTATALLRLMARRQPRCSGQRTHANNEWVTLYHPDAAKSLTEEQKEFFEHFGYDIAYLASRPPRKRQHFSQAERQWSNQPPDNDTKVLHRS
jgi:hypothetical protein